jgi:hypothetical protein
MCYINLAIRYHYNAGYTRTAKNQFYIKCKCPKPTGLMMYKKINGKTILWLNALKFLVCNQKYKFREPTPFSNCLSKSNYYIHILSAEENAYNVILRRQQKMTNSATEKNCPRHSTKAPSFIIYVCMSG